MWGVFRGDWSLLAAGACIALTIHSPYDFSMTKNGKPSRITGIRCFVGKWQSLAPKDYPEVAEFENRLALYLNGEGVSLGTFLEPYVAFMTDMPEGRIAIQPPNEFHEMWWHRYVYVGVPAGFPDIPEAVELARNGIIAALKAFLPKTPDIIDEAVKVVDTEQGRLRFLYRVKERKDYTIYGSATSTVFTSKNFHVTLLRHADGKLLDAPAMEVPFTAYPNEFFGSLALVKGEVVIRGQGSFSAMIGNAFHKLDLPVNIPLDQFTELDVPPVMSGLIHPRG